MDSATFSPLFGWISARGKMPLDDKNANLTVECLAMAISAKEIIVERKCIQAIIFPDQFYYSSFKWSTQGKNMEAIDVTPLALGNDKNERPIMLFQQQQHVTDNRHFNAFPCIFPISDQIADHLAWNATVCGLSNENASDHMPTSNEDEKMEGRHRIACHSISFNGSKVTEDGHNAVQQYFLPDSSLFLFNANDDSVAFLGSMEKSETNSNELRTFTDEDCLSLANSTEGRVQCAQNGLEMAAAQEDPLNLLNSTDLTTTTQIPFTQKNSPVDQQESAGDTLALLPLIVLSVLAASGMLITIVSFIVQKHRQIYYDTL